jgi:peptide-methionine (S)-S-oxide reductase
VGYCGGFSPNPTYEEACSGKTGHTEGCRVVYDETQVSFVDLLRLFWESHDPTSGMGQGNDRGSQYRSGFYYTDDEQKALIEASRDAYETALAAAKSGQSRKITTEIQSARHYDQYGGLWYFAEPYHQQYLAKPGSRPYCSAQPQGVSLPAYDTWCPFDTVELKEKHRPKLPESFWTQHAPKRGCSVTTQTNDPIQLDEL